MAKLVYIKSRKAMRCQFTRKVTRHALRVKVGEKCIGMPFFLHEDAMRDIYEIYKDNFLNPVAQDEDVQEELPSDESTDEKTDNPPPDEEKNASTGDEIPTNFMKLKKFAAEKGMTVTNETKKEEILAWLQENGHGE
jgi:hypothetical protein